MAVTVKPRGRESWVLADAYRQECSCYHDDCAETREQDLPSVAPRHVDSPISAKPRRSATIAPGAIGSTQFPWVSTQPPPWPRVAARHQPTGPRTTRVRQERESSISVALRPRQPECPTFTTHVCCRRSMTTPQWRRPMRITTQRAESNRERLMANVQITDYKSVGSSTGSSTEALRNPGSEPRTDRMSANTCSITSAGSKLSPHAAIIRIRPSRCSFGSWLPLNARAKHRPSCAKRPKI